MKQTFAQLVAAVLPQIRELMPWDVQALREQQPQTLLVDIREPDEYAAAHIEGSLLVSRGVLESACDWGYSDTVPELAAAREAPVVLVCRSGSRTALAAFSLQQMGYQQVYSMKSGLRGWNDFDLPLVDATGALLDGDTADERLNPPVRAQQMPRSVVRGFTLVELVMVIVILGVLAALALPRFVNLGTDARVAAVNSLAAAVRTAVGLAQSACAVATSCNTQLPYTSNPTVTVNGQVRYLHHGYPTAWGNASLNRQGDISYWLQSYSGFTRSVYVSGNWWVDFTKDGAPDPLTCKVRYQVTPANNTTNPALTTVVISETTSGC